MVPTNRARELRIALIRGGDSSERQVSLLSGEAAREALVALGFEVVEIDPSLREDLSRLTQEDFDLAFLAMHGKHGEDGTIQGMLELIGLPYTGSGVWSSATAIDKAKTKERYRAAGVPTPDWQVFALDGVRAEDVLQAGFSLPCVVKVIDGGSSIGVAIARDSKELTEALNDAAELSDRVLVERHIEGRELTVAVLGNKAPEALPAIEFSVPGDFDFEAKYVDHDIERVCPAPLSETQARSLAKLAEAAHSTLECSGLSRTDFLLDDDGTFWALETNTVPGMRRGSFAEQAAKAAGIPYAQLCMKLVELALEREA